MYNSRDTIVAARLWSAVRAIFASDIIAIINTNNKTGVRQYFGTRRVVCCRFLLIARSVPSEQNGFQGVPVPTLFSYVDEVDRTSIGGRFRKGASANSDRGFRIADGRPPNATDCGTAVGCVCGVGRWRIRESVRDVRKIYRHNGPPRGHFAVI